MVDPTPDELTVLAAAAEPWRAVRATDLADALDDASEVDAVLVGSGAGSPAPVVQQVHGADPATAVGVLTTPDTDAEVRRTLSYTPGVPTGLLVVRSGDAGLLDAVGELVEAARTERRHRALLAAVSDEPGERRAPPLLPRSLGPLLHHAPFGVLVADVEGRFVGWNPRAADLLRLGGASTGQPVADVFTEPEPLLGAFVLARAGRLEAATPSFVLEGPPDTALEVSVAPTVLENGDPAVLLLVQDVTERQRAETTRDRLAAHVGLLGRVSETLAGTLDGEAALRRLAGQVVPVLGDWVSLQLYDGRGNPRRVAVHHDDPAMRELVELVESRLPGALAEDAPSRRVARGEGPVRLTGVTGTTLDEIVTVPEVGAALRELGVGGLLAVPLPGRDAVLGSMVLLKRPSSDPFTEEDLAVATEVGRRAGVTLETIGLYARQSDLAAELQRSLLSEPPPSEDVEVVVRYLAAAEEAQVGGDWYDAFVQTDDATVLVIGDVIGHDTRAAAAMGQIRALLRGIGYTTGTGPSGMLARLDAAMAGLDVHTTATAVVAALDRAPGESTPRRLRWSNAGHPPPVLVGPGDRARVLQAEESDLLLGVIADVPRRESELLLEPGMTLLLYTDGLVERRGRPFDRGVADLVEAAGELGRLPLERLCDRLLERLLPDQLDDDVALLAVRLRS